MARNYWDPYALHVAREMGRQWRRKYLGELPGGDCVAPGYATRSVMGKLKDEWEGASQSRVRQFFPEFYTGDGLKGRRALYVLNDCDRMAITWHFYAKGVPVKLKAAAIGWPVRTYWWKLNKGMLHLASELHKLEPEDVARQGSSPVQILTSLAV